MRANGAGGPWGWREAAVWFGREWLQFKPASDVYLRRGRVNAESEKRAIRKRPAAEERDGDTTAADSLTHLHCG